MGERPPLLLAVALVLLATGCRVPAPGAPDGPPLPPSAPVVSVELREYAFELGDAPPRGRVRFEARNTGREAHQLILLAVPEELPAPVAELLGREGERLVLPTVVNLGVREPGARGVFATDLGPGGYALVCLVEDEEGVTHAERGMVAEFTVR